MAKNLSILGLCDIHGKFSVVREAKKKKTTCGREYEIPTRVVCPKCRMWGKVLEVEDLVMKYGDGEPVELGDTIEGSEAPDRFEPEEATVIRIGKAKIQIEYTNENIKPRKVYADPAHCELIARAG